MSPDDRKAETGGAGRENAETNRAHTPQGAPTDQAHRDSGDGSLTGSVPAGLTTEQLEETARSDKTDDSGAE